MIKNSTNGSKEKVDLLLHIQKLMHEVAVLDTKLRSVQSAATKYKLKAAQCESRFILQKSINEDLRQAAAK